MAPAKSMAAFVEQKGTLTGHIAPQFQPQANDRRAMATKFKADVPPTTLKPQQPVQTRPATRPSDVLRGGQNIGAMLPPPVPASHNQAYDRPESVRSDMFGTDYEGYTNTSVPSVVQIEDSQLESQGRPIGHPMSVSNEVFEEREEDYEEAVGHENDYGHGYGQPKQHSILHLNQTIAGMHHMLGSQGQLATDNSYATTTSGVPEDPDLHDQEEEGIGSEEESGEDESEFHGEQAASPTPAPYTSRSQQQFREEQPAVRRHDQHQQQGNALPPV
ncbi:hypothetical protein LTS18_015079, partial [Coniosporium uncinatum]